MTARILVVDDNPHVAGMLSDLLSISGHHADIARNGARALERLAEREFDLIISDVMMPELGGEGLYRELERRHPRYLERLIFMTGRHDREVVAFLGDAPVPVLRKPFSIADVRRHVRAALDTSATSAGPAERGPRGG